MKEGFPQLERLGIPSSLVREILEDEEVTLIRVRDGLPSKSSGSTSLGHCRPFLGVIELNGAVDPKAVADEIREGAGIDLDEKEVFTFVLLHEWAHNKGHHDEADADRWASERLAQMRGYSRKIHVDLDIEEGIRKSIRDALQR